MVHTYYFAFVESIIYVFNKLQRFLQSTLQCVFIVCITGRRVTQGHYICEQTSHRH